MITSVLHDLFHWPDGIVVGNLIASLLWIPVQWTGMHLRLKAHSAATHARLDAQDDVLANQDVILADMREILDDLRSSQAGLQRKHDSS